MSNNERRRQEHQEEDPTLTSSVAGAISEITFDDDAALPSHHNGNYRQSVRHRTSHSHGRQSSLTPLREESYYPDDDHFDEYDDGDDGEKPRRTTTRRHSSSRKNKKSYHRSEELQETLDRIHLRYEIEDEIARRRGHYPPADSRRRGYYSSPIRSSPRQRLYGDSRNHTSMRQLSSSPLRSRDHIPALKYTSSRALARDFPRVAERMNHRRRQEQQSRERKARHHYPAPREERRIEHREIVPRRKERYNEPLPTRDVSPQTKRKSVAKDTNHTNEAALKNMIEVYEEILGELVQKNKKLKDYVSGKMNVYHRSDFSMETNEIIDALEHLKRKQQQRPTTTKAARAAPKSAMDNINRESGNEKRTKRTHHVSQSPTVQQKSKSQSPHLIAKQRRHPVDRQLLDNDTKEYKKVPDALADSKDPYFDIPRNIIVDASKIKSSPQDKKKRRSKEKEKRQDEHLERKKEIASTERTPKDPEEKPEIIVLDDCEDPSQKKADAPGNSFIKVPLNDKPPPPVFSTESKYEWPAFLSGGGGIGEDEPSATIATGFDAKVLQAQVMAKALGCVSLVSQHAEQAAKWKSRNNDIPMCGIGMNFGTASKNQPSFRYENQNHTSSSIKIQVTESREEEAEQDLRRGDGTNDNDNVDDDRSNIALVSKTRLHEQSQRNAVTKESEINSKNKNYSFGHVTRQKRQDILAKAAKNQQQNHHRSNEATTKKIPGEATPRTEEGEQDPEAIVEHGDYDDTMEIQPSFSSLRNLASKRKSTLIHPSPPSKVYSYDDSAIFVPCVASNR